MCEQIQNNIFFFAYLCRDNELDPGDCHSNRDESVGAWVLHSQQYAKTEPLYAVCAKQANAPAAPIKKVSMPVAPPVVLREPTPPSTLNLMTASAAVDNQNSYPPHHMSHMRHCPQPPRNLLISSNQAVVNKRAPPPPKRSETTQLSTT